MDQFGDLLHNWSVGYNGSPVYFLDDKTICYTIGNCVKFVNIEDDSVNYLPSPGDGIATLAVNPLYGFITFSENGVNARIFIYHKDDFSEPQTVLEGSGESLGFTCLAFANNGSLLASCTNIPDRNLTLWNWPEGVEYCSYSLEGNIERIIFNPQDWRQFCCIYEKTLFLWNIEKVNDSYHLQKKKVNLPKTDGTFGLEFIDGDSVNVSNRPTTGLNAIQLTKSAMAGLIGEGKEKFLIQNEDNRCEAICFCWEPNNQLLCSCSSGILLRLDVETQNTVILKNKNAENKVEITFNDLQLHQNGVYGSVKDGTLCDLKFTKDGYKLQAQVQINKQLSNLQFSPDFITLILSGPSGCIYKYIDGNLSPVVEDECLGEIIGIDNVAGNNEYLVIGRAEGLLNIFSTKDGLMVGKVDVNTKVTCLKSPASSCSVYLGTEEGSVIVVNLTHPSSPKCVFQKRIHEGPVTFLKIDDTGMIMATSSTDGHLFFFNATVSSNLGVLGHIDFAGDVVCMSIRSVRENESNKEVWKVVVGLSTSGHKPGANQLIEMTLTKDLFKGPASLFLDDTKLLKDISISKRIFVMKTFLYDVCLLSENVAFGIVHHGNRIAKFNLADEQETTSTSANTVLDASFTYPGHGLAGGQINLSCHRKWLVTSSSDGHLLLRAVGAMNNIVCVQSGDYRAGGIQYVRFTADAQQVVTVTKTGVVSNWTWKYTAFGKSKATAAIECFKSKLVEVRDVKNKEDAFMKDMKKIEKTDDEGATWLNMAIKSAHRKEDEKYKSTKENLKSEINSLRSQVLQMMKSNDQVPNIEKLDRHEYNMDIEERNLLLTEREKLLKELRYEVELKDTAQQYLWSLVKNECWDQMVVKGRHIISFHNNAEVANYAMREMSAEELLELEYVTQLRQVEEIELTCRKNIFPPEISSYASLVEKPEETDDEISEIARALKNESAATYGSLGFAYGGNNELLQSQFTLHTKSQKKSQIVLLKDCIYHIKQEFNKIFDEVYNAKLQEVKRIEERNVRIQKILSDLNMTEALTTTEGSTLEQPERLFTVEESEITVEKYISEEERVRLEEQARLDAEQRLAENADNLRGRALDMMMAGRLETGLEDELKKEIEVPDFMDKPQDNWSEEEQKMAKEYERKKVQLNEEREKYRKSLEMELKKLQATNIDTTKNFDERLRQLFQKKVKTEAVILQEELKIIRLTASILTDQELEAGEIELLNNLEVKKEEKQQSSLAVGDVRRDVEQFRDSYEMLLADDKTLDKMFRKEFSELDTHTIDVLYRLFKKRPRAQRTLKAAMESQGDTTTSDKRNPFQLRPSSSRAHSAAAANVERAMLELDSEHHMPENIDEETWQRLVGLRRNKVEKEQQLKSNALILADMNSFLQKKMDEDEELKQDVEKVFEEIQNLRDERLRFNLNLEVQLLLKQGQIEVGKCDLVPDYTVALLIHRSAVEDLNATIKTLGESKLASMRESKEFRKGIHILAWQLKEMFMRAEDLQSAALDLQLLRVTKDLQVYLSETDQRKSKQQEISTLEKTIGAYDEMHRRKIGDKKRTLRKLRRQIKDKEEENRRLDVNLEEMALDVAERNHINKANAEGKKMGANDEVMHNIITRRKLVDLAKTQASQIGMLRAEVERLRMRTFPALVQLDS